MGPAAIPVVAIVATVASTAVAAYGQYQSSQASAASSRSAGQAANAQAQYQAAVADINKRTAERNTLLAERNASYVEAAGARQMDERVRRQRQMTGAQRAALAANGLLIDEGSGADIQRDTTNLGRLALSEIGENARRQASGYRIQGVNAAEEAAAASLRGESYRTSGTNAVASGEFAADNATTAGWLSAGGSLLGGATRTFDRWSDMQRTGAVNNNPPPVE